MTADTVLSLGRESALVILALGGPMIGAALVTGVIVSLFQAVTQVQESSLTFVPKVVVMMVVLAFLGHWMLARLVGYTVTLLSGLEAYGR
jgi:flagellar biosynthetic protein FliQ